MVPSGQDDEQVQHMHSRHKALEEMSLIQNRHPAIAYLYGRNAGPKYNRFIVLNTGYVKRLGELIRDGPLQLSIAGRMISQLVDALCHLRKHGVGWRCYWSGDLCLDEKYQPKIGVLDELFTIPNTPEDEKEDNYCNRVSDILHLTGRSLSDAEECEFLDSDYRSARWFISLFGELMDEGHLAWYSENVVEHTDIPELIPLSQESRMYLHQCDYLFADGRTLWSDVLFSLSTGVSIGEGSILHMEYDLSDNTIEVLCLENDGTTVRHLHAELAIPQSTAKEIREQLGIAWEDSGKGGEGVVFCQDLAFPPGATSVESSGWFKRQRYW